jgi:putative Mn2+ efflux pump MntP
MYEYKGLVGSILIGLFGLYLIWNGLTGNISKTIDRKSIIPRWMHVLGGVILLIFPAVWILVRI